MGEGASNTLLDESRSPAVLDRVFGGPPLLSGRLRTGVLVVSLLALAGLAGFGFAARNSRRALLFDHAVGSLLRRMSGPGHRVAILFSDVGHPEIFIAIASLVTIGLVLLGDYRAAASALVGVAATLVLVEKILKPFFDRQIGRLAGPVFPSGHAAVAVALAGAVVLAARPERPLGRVLGRTWCGVLMTIALLTAGSIGVAMIVVQLHYASDVLVGLAVGLAVSGGAAQFLDSVAARRQKRDHERHGRPRPRVAADPAPR